MNLMFSNSLISIMYSISYMYMYMYMYVVRCVCVRVWMSPLFPPTGEKEDSESAPKSTDFQRDLLVRPVSPHTYNVHVYHSSYFRWSVGTCIYMLLYTYTMYIVHVQTKGWFII